MPNFALLARVARGETKFGRPANASPADGERYDQLVDDLLELEERGYLVLSPRPMPYTQGGGRWNMALVREVSDAGHAALRQAGYTDPHAG